MVPVIGVRMPTTVALGIIADMAAGDSKARLLKYGRRRPQEYQAAFFVPARARAAAWQPCLLLADTNGNGPLSGLIDIGPPQLGHSPELAPVWHWIKVKDEKPI